jgi:glycine cleavage system H protein
MDGEVVEANDSLSGSPETINDDPFGEGWLVKIRFTQLPDLLSSSEYDAFIGE